MIPSSIIAKMASLGLSETQATAVASMLSDVEAATETDIRAKCERESGLALALARSSNADRQARYRERNVTQTLGNVEKRNKTLRNASSRACRLTATWKPTPEMVDFALGQGLTSREIEAQGEAMRDWSLSAPTGKKLDWLATWRGWVRRFLETRTKTNGNHGGVIAALGRLDFGDDDIFARPEPMPSSSGKGQGATAYGLLPKG